MKVLQINNFHYPRGGSDQYFLELTRLLREGGVSARTFSTASQRNMFEDWLIAPGVESLSTDSTPGLRNVVRFFYSRNARKALLDALDRYSPHVVHLHIYYGQLTPSILRPIVDRGIPIVQTLHEYKTVCATGGLFSNGHDCERCGGREHWKAVLERCNRGSVLRSILSASEMYFCEALGSRNFVDQFIAVSQYQKERLVRLGMPSAKVEVISNFSTSSGQQINRKRHHLLYVGRLSPGKGVECLLKAVAAVGFDMPSLHIVGEGESRASLENLAHVLGLDSKVEWKGFLTGSALAREYEEALLFINPSELNETFGLTALEALAHGCPVVASSSGALPEIVRDGVDGLIFRPGDSAALSGCLKKMMADFGIGEKMGNSGYRRATEQFSKEAHLAKILQIYEGALKLKRLSNSSIDPGFLQR